MQPTTRLIFAAFAASTLISAAAMAATQDTGNQGYLVDSDGNVVRSGSGLCWHTSEWTPQLAVESCDQSSGQPMAAVEPAPRSPQPVAAPPAPTPRPESVKPLPHRISFSGDAMFSFDKSELKPEGKAMLDELVLQLDGATYDTILVTGHADRLGGEEYNQKLSERRALEVKNYLMSKNIPANRINAQGQGETAPSEAGECRGDKSANLVNCLRADRRVDIEMRGSN